MDEIVILTYKIIGGKFYIPTWGWNLMLERDEAQVVEDWPEVLSLWSAFKQGDLWGSLFQIVLEELKSQLPTFVKSEH